MKKYVSDFQKAADDAANLATFVQAEIVGDRLDALSRGLTSRSGSEGSLGSKDIADEIAPKPSGWMSVAVQAHSSNPSSSDNTSEAEEVQTFSLMALRESDSNDWMSEAEVIPVPERTPAGGSASSHGQPARPTAEYHYVGDSTAETQGPRLLDLSLIHI